jgi:hypothetical protein
MTWSVNRVQGLIRCLLKQSDMNLHHLQQPALLGMFKGCGYLQISSKVSDLSAASVGS